MAGALILGAGVILLGYLLVDELFLAARPATRQRASEMVSRLGRVPWTAYLPIPVSIVLAYLMRHGILILVYVLAVGIVTTVHLARRARVQQRLDIEEEIKTLVESFRSVYRIKPAIFSALEEAREKVAEPLRGHVTAAVETFHITSSQKRAFATLRKRSDNPYLNQFVYILERIEAARQEAVLDAMGNLIERLRRRQELRRQTEIDLTVITLQIRFILFISLAIIFAIALIKPLRTVYTASLGSQLWFIGIATIGVVTAYLIDRRVMALKERVL
jgi:Flp pilus assembly protein TadB